MKMIKLFFEWPIKNILRHEFNIINRSRLKMLSYGLMLRVITTVIAIVSLYAHDNQTQANSTLILYIILLIVLALTRLNVISWVTVVHYTLISMTVLVWANIFYFDREINLITTQFILLVFIYANYLLDKQGRFIYPLLNIVPVVLFTVFKQEIRAYPIARQMPVDELTYFVSIMHNFVFIFFTQYYFLNTFNRAVDKLQTSRNELSRQVLFQKRLIAGISHDIKSPLKYLAITIKGVFKRAEAERSEWVDDLKDAYQSSFKVYHFTENLLQYAHVYLENDDIDLNIVNLHVLINEKIDIFSDMARAQECRVHNYIDPSIQVLTNKPSLTVIIHNLLENAIKYTSKGSVTFHAMPGDEQFMISINDTGRGMEPELMAWCNRTTSADDQKGVKAVAPHQGLGLIIVNQLLRKIGGRMTVRNMPVSGTSIQLMLPLYQAYANDQKSPVTALR